MHAEGFADDGIEDGEAFEFFVGWWAEGTVGVTKLLSLFLEDSVTFSQIKKKLDLEAIVV